MENTVLWFVATFPSKNHNKRLDSWSLHKISVFVSGRLRNILNRLVYRHENFITIACTKLKGFMLLDYVVHKSLNDNKQAKKLSRKNEKLWFYVRRTFSSQILLFMDKLFEFSSLRRSEVVGSSNFYVQSSEKLCLKVKSAIINQNKFALKSFRSSRRPKKGFRLVEAICDWCSWSFLLLPDENRCNFCSRSGSLT